MKNMAMIKDGLVENVAKWDGISNWNPAGYLLVDVSNRPEICPGWTYTNSVFSSPQLPVIPVNLEQKAENFINFGTELFKEIKKQVWVTNMTAQLQGAPFSEADVLALVPYSDTLQKVLESGSLLTAKQVLAQLSTALPQYASIAANATTQINAKLAE